MPSCFFALNNNLKISIILLIVAGICDLFDGFIARKIKRTDVEKEFGVQLDTVVDVISFCMTPVIIVYSTAGSSWHALLIYAFYVICGVIRLAYFNTSNVPGEPVQFYNGLPVTYIALILPIIMLFHVALVSIITLAVVGVLFILNIKISKPRGVWYILFPVIAVVVAVLWWFI